MRNNETRTHKNIGAMIASIFTTVFIVIAFEVTIYDVILITCAALIVLVICAVIEWCLIKKKENENKKESED